MLTRDSQDCSLQFADEFAYMALDGETARILRTILQLHQQRVQEYRRLDTCAGVY